ncbi:MAG: chromosomal replication initiator protein DnaA [Pirellulales bacterium]|nr:chromosomal replication initiator protein DnaA [Pirellulales bacterium]
MTKDDREIVSALRTSLTGKVGQDRFDLWFGAATRLDFDGRTLRIGAPNPFFLEWIRANFRRPIEHTCRELLGKCPALEFHLVDGGEAQSSPAGENESRPPENMARPPENVAQPSSAVSPSAAPTRGREGRCRADANQPNRRDESRHRFASLDAFVVGETNRLAVASARMVVNRPGRLTPLLFHGPTSVGKTHLLEGIWSAVRKSHDRSSVLYLTAEQFTSYFLDALRGSGLPSFRRKYRGVGLLILDDLQFFVGKRATQVELLHTIDGFLREGRQLVFAADRSPAELAELGPELTTRLSSGLVCRIDPPDYATRLGIVAQMARRMKIDVPGEVQQYVAARLTSHARELSGALCRLQATAEAIDRPISMEMAPEALTDLVRNSTRAVRLPDIEKAVCEVFGLDASSLQSGSKGKRISHPRMLAMWLARKHTRAALSEIGHYFGRRSHSTVVSAQKRVDAWMASGAPLDLAERRWPVDDAIRQVESRLAAG